MGVDFFKWNKIYNTGIVKIDSQHKNIINILNKLHEVFMIRNDEILLPEKEKKLELIMSELVEYTKYHFKEEEELFEKYGFNKTEEHLKKHNIFIEEINKIKKGKENKQAFLVINLINFLKEWLINHIMIEDQEYAAFYKENNITSIIND